MTLKKYRAHFKTTNAKGEILYDNNNFTFRTRNRNDYINRAIGRYTSHNIKAEFTDIEEV